MESPLHDTRAVPRVVVTQAESALEVTTCNDTALSFRNTILQKMIGPEKRTAPDLSEEFGVSVATIYGWKAETEGRYPFSYGKGIV